MTEEVGYRKNVYIRKENAGISKDVGSLSEFLNHQLTLERKRREREAPENQKSREIASLRSFLRELQQEQHRLEDDIANQLQEKERLALRILDGENRLKEVISNLGFKIDRKDFLDKAYECGEECANRKQFFGNVRDGTNYQFDRVEKGELFILNCNTGGRKSSLGEKTLKEAIQRLEEGNGRVAYGGGLIGNTKHEEAIVAMHPDVWVRDGEIVYDADFIETIGYIHCKMCGEDDAAKFAEMRRRGYYPGDEPELIGHYCQSCGHRTHLEHDFNLAEYYGDLAQEMMESQMDAYREESRR